MKFKKILSSVVAAAMAVTTFSAFSTTSTAETLYYTGSLDEYNTINYSFDITALADTDAISATVYDSTIEDADAYPFILFQLSDSNTNWGNDCYISKPITDDIAEANAETITVTVGELKAKYEEVVGSAWTSSTKLRFAFWNGGTANTTIEVDTDYVAPTTDVWVDNGDGSYSLTRGTAASPAKFTIPLDDGENHIATAVAITVEDGDGYTNGCLGSNVYDGNPGGTWENVTWDEESAMAIYNPSSSLETYPEFQVWYAAVGTKITISIVQSVYAYTKYEQQTNDGSACRGVMYIQESEVENIESVDFYFSNDGGATTKKVSSTKYYESVSVGGNIMTAPEGYVIVAYAITNIPDGESVTCEDIDLNRN
ncbi:MAG: hypothetical protein IJ031_02025 [Oscillospiraceae bacterium]|nr:hypothetical protein [Oscillospiraceae bacterium]